MMWPTPPSTPSEAARWRRTAVQPLIEVYACEPDVDAVMLSGSVARGNADRWSDAELGVFWSRPPTADDRRRLARTGGAQDAHIFPLYEPEAVWCDDLYLGGPSGVGLLVEVVHAETVATEKALAAVFDDHDPNPAGLNRAQGVVDGIAFHGHEVLAGWKRRAAVYPRELAVAVVERAGVIDHFWRWDMYAERRNPAMLALHFATVCEQVVMMLLALNRRYGPHPKWLDTIAASLDLAPPGLTDRIAAVFTSDPPAAAASLTDLVRETFDLVQAGLPEADVGRLRRVFSHRRRPLEELPGR
jgi:hypothetical protein